MSKEKFNSTDFLILLLSYLKLENVSRIDVLQLGYSLANYYYVNEYRDLLSCFELRKTIYNDDIVDIDGILMDAYLLGYIDDKRNILFDINMINNEIIPSYSDEQNKVVKSLVKLLITKFDNYKCDENRNFISDLFFKRIHRFKGSGR